VFFRAQALRSVAAAVIKRGESMADKKLTGRRVVVTGAANGIGRAIAVLFAENGARLALIDRDKQALEQICALTEGTPLVCDLADPAETRDAARAAAEAMGGVDGIVNAAGILITNTLDSMSPDAWDRLLAVNLSAPFHLVSALLPALREAPSATIVNLSSSSAFKPPLGMSGYAATKAGLLQFTRALAIDLAPTIRANAICPGPIRTRMTSYLWTDDERGSGIVGRVPLGRFGTPEDIAKVALFLSCDDSAFVNGADIVADGGFTLV
jgi:NAD(P)-dependent dehydrogenase (short-subunit alcohol dehydrogenase family)